MIKAPTCTGGTDEEYETQHFGFGSQQFKIAIREQFEYIVRKCITQGFSDLQESLELNETDRKVLSHSRDKLIQLYCEKTDSAFTDNIDNEIDNIMKIPPNVLLPEDEDQMEQFSDFEYIALKEEVENLKKRILGSALIETRLLAEDKELSAIEKTWELAKKDMEAIDLMKKNLNDDSVKLLMDKLLFLKSRVPSIKTMYELLETDEVCSP